MQVRTADVIDVVARELGELPGEEPWRGEVLRRAARLQAALRAGDEPGAWLAAIRLLGLGEGSTPAGDDYLVGVIHALREVPGRVAGEGPRPRASAALLSALGTLGYGRTTAASAAWISAAARGEASPVWRSLLDAIAAGDAETAARAARAVRGTGHTSGAFSLRGFLDTVAA